MTNAPRIATVSLNPAIDQTALVPNFTAGAVNRVQREQSDAGGKGVNVASFLAHFGLPVSVTGLLGDANSEPFVRLFREKGIVDRFVRVPGLTRVNVKIVDEAQDRVTDINFPGLQASNDDLARLYAAVDALAEDTQWFVLSGSVPAGVPDAVYAELVARLKRRGKTVVLDASGPPFAAAIPTSPDIIKPNIEELRELVGRRLSGHAEVAEAARALVGRGIGLVAVSMGSEGAVFVERDEAVIGDSAENYRQEHRRRRGRHGRRHRHRRAARVGPGRSGAPGDRLLAGRAERDRSAAAEAQRGRGRHAGCPRPADRHTGDSGSVRWRRSLA